MPEPPETIPVENPRPNPDIPPRGSPLFRINQDDLCELERILPDLQGMLFDKLANPLCAPRLKTQLGIVKRIISDVRWDYGPPSKVIVMAADDLTGDDLDRPPTIRQ